MDFIIYNCNLTVFEICVLLNTKVHIRVYFILAFYIIYTYFNSIFDKFKAEILEANNFSNRVSALWRVLMHEVRGISMENLL